ncbi:VOC family protein [Arthrobacter sp. Cr_A7]|uniref:VOC family protein n=1 Tax=Arthrobacter sp. Cr_A7 TaxID=3031017 RepID=UPI0023DBDDC1|nr:VOC family protein [Arthrobacter sp. Cr_A7]MDF2050415.1 VOC family protein [Arthrobacter sp. Cr_A7]
MIKSIYVSLPVKDLEASTEFISKVFGAEKISDFSSETTSLIPLNPVIFLALMTEQKFSGYLKDGTIVAAPEASPTAVETMLAVNVDTHDEVEQVLARALQSGGQPWTGVFEMGTSHCATFLDPDGHIWEVIYHPNPYWEGSLQNSVTAITS